MPGTGPGSNGAQLQDDREKAYWRIFNEETIVLVRRWLRLLGVPRRDRKDLSQDVMLAAHESFPKYDPERGAPERWLNRIAVHIASHYGERSRRRVEVPLPDDFDDVYDQPSAEELLGSEGERLFALSLLRELDDEYRVILVAHDIEGVSMAEIASQYRIPLSTAYKRRNRALAAFQLLAAQRRAATEGPPKTAARPARGKRQRPALTSSARQ